MKQLKIFIFLMFTLITTGNVYAQRAYFDIIKTRDGRDSVYVMGVPVKRDTVWMQAPSQQVIEREVIKIVRDTVWMQGSSQFTTEREVIKVVHDTIWMAPPAEAEPTDMIKTKAIGRYDRGIKNYRFIPKGKWMGGVTVSYINFDSNDSQMLFSLLKDFSFNGKTFSVKPSAGYAISDNMVVGFKFGYNHTLAQLDNFAVDYDDLDISMKDLRYTQDIYSFGIYHRSYVGMERTRRFGLFNEVSLSYNNGTSRFTRGKDEEMIATDTKVHELHIGLNPGVCVFIMENVSAEMSFGVVGFKYRSEKQINNLGEVGKSRNSGANFKINLFNINIGVTVCF